MKRYIIIEVNNFRADLSNISAKTATLEIINALAEFYSVACVTPRHHLLTTSLICYGYCVGSFENVHEVIITSVDYTKSMCIECAF